MAGKENGGKGYQDNQYIFLISNTKQYDRIIEMALVQGNSCFGNKKVILRLTTTEMGSP